MGKNKEKSLAFMLQGFFFRWEQRESNPRPSACKADALNQLSYAPKLSVKDYFRNGTANIGTNFYFTNFFLFFH